MVEAGIGWHRLLQNAFWRFRQFDVYTQTVPDSLHCADTGLYQTILIAIFRSIRTELFDQLENADRRWLKAMQRLKVRLTRWTGIDTAAIGKWVSSVGFKINDAMNSDEGSHALFKASDFRALMLVTVPLPRYRTEVDMAY